MLKVVGKYWVQYSAESFGTGRESWNGVYAIFDHEPKDGSDPLETGEAGGGSDTANPAIDAAYAAGIARAKELDGHG
jgi:hypothetical protein